MMMQQYSDGTMFSNNAKKTDQILVYV